MHMYVCSQCDDVISFGLGMRVTHVLHVVHSRSQLLCMLCYYHFIKEVTSSAKAVMNG